MTGRDALRIILDREDISISELARLDGSARSGVSNLITRKTHSITLKRFVDLLTLLEYELVVRPKKPLPFNEDEIVIDEIPED